MAKTSTYGASNIQVLEGLEAVRKRPAMYIGSTDSMGLHHIFTEILDNSVDEAIAGFCDHIWVTLNKDNSCTVRDNGRGIPIEIHPQTKVSTLETVMTNLHAGGKFDQGAYKVSGGLHGVGMKCTNALSERMETIVCKDGGRYKQEYKRGIPQYPVKKIGTCKETGTEHTFKPDPEIFEETDWNFKTIVKKCRQHAYLTAGLWFTIVDDRVEEREKGKVFELYFEDGIKSYVQFLNIDEKVISQQPFYMNREVDDIWVEIAIQYTDGMDENVMCYTNNIINPEGGTHLAGFRMALTTAVNTYAQENELLKGVKDALSGDDVREGLTAVVSVKVTDPQFEGQTKIKLNNREVRGAVSSLLRDELLTYFNENPDIAKNIIGKAVLAHRAKVAAKAARDAIVRKSALENSTLPGKLADCISNDPVDSELYIVEGDSAGGCFSGDTQIALVDGRSLSFLDLIKEQKDGKQNFCYTIGDDKNIEVSEIVNVRRTKLNTAVVKITLDNEEEIVCTPDHKFMLRDGEYKEAKSLTKEDSLMPLYRKMSEKGKRITIEGYEQVLNPSTSRWLFTHILSDKYNLNNNKYSNNLGTHRHHIDFNKKNNNPTNLIRLTKERHLKIHQEQAKKTLHNEDVFSKLRKLKKTKAFREKMSKAMLRPEIRQILSINAKKQWEDEAYKEYMRNKFLAYYYTHEEYRKKNEENLLENSRQYWGKEENRKKQADRVTKFFENNPGRKEELSKLAQEQWENEDLRLWRAQKTKDQWTKDFRRKRQESYNKTYLDKGLKVMKELYEKYGKITQKLYDDVRKETNDKSIIKMSTICSRFFNGKMEDLLEAAKNYNHKIKSIEFLDEKIDVYDLEVPKTHNFALASGIFVHNSAKQGRDRHTQAVLPLRGKIINTHKYRVDRVLNNNEFNYITTALGVGIGDSLDINKLRYHKVIIMSDADVDGLHITTLVLTLFFRFFRPLIEAGYIYVAQPPLFKVEVGKKKEYFINEKTKDAYVLKAKDAGKNPVVNRFKGLGEMDPEQLWDTTMSPESRVLKRVKIDDAQEAEHVFEMLMGSEVPPRRHFIQKHANQAILDV